MYTLILIFTFNVLAYVIGKRTLPHAVSLIEKVKNITRCIPTLFSSGQLAQYANALIQVYGKIRKRPSKEWQANYTIYEC